jgi:spore coat protein U-like protein
MIQRTLFRLLAPLLVSVWVPSVALACTAGSAGVSFGAYDPLAGAAVDGVGTITVSCPASTPFTIDLGPGGGSYAARQMQSGAATMSYNLYTDAARLTVWGDGTSGTSRVSDSSSGGDYTVYGRIPAGQNLPAGAYNDSVQITVTF